jgi:hypothetical protein
MAKGGRSFFFGFNAGKTTDGKPPGHATIKIRPRNAYELLGLRRPVGNQFGKS